MFTIYIYIQYLLNSFNTCNSKNLNQSLHNRETITMLFLYVFSWLLRPETKNHRNPSMAGLLTRSSCLGPWGCRDARHWIQISWRAIERTTNYWGNIGVMGFNDKIDSDWLSWFEAKKSYEIHPFPNVHRYCIIHYLRGLVDWGRKCVRQHGQWMCMTFSYNLMIMSPCHVFLHIPIFG